MLRNLSIRRRLVIIVVGMTFMIVMAVAFIALNGSRELMRNQTVAALLEHNQALANGLDGRMQAAVATTRALANVLSRQNGSPVTLLWQTTSNSMLEEAGLIRRVNVYAPFRDGHQFVIFDYPLPPSKTAPLTQLVNNPIPQEAAFINSVQGLTWYGPQRAVYAAYSGPVMSIAVPYYNYDDQPIGVLWTDLPTAEIAQELENAVAAQDLGRRGYSLLLDANGTLIATYRVTDDTEEQPLLAASSSMLNSSQIQVVMELLGEDGNFREVEGFFLTWDSALIVRNILPNTGWQMVSILPGELLSNPIDSNVLQTAFVVLVGTLAIAYVVYYIATRWISNPLNELTVAAQEIGFGEMRYQIGYQQRPDEIGMLSRALEDMKINLDYSYGEVARWGRTLETRVVERTTELEIARQEAQATAAGLQAVYDASISAISDHQLPVILQTLSERIAILLPTRYCAVWLLTSDKEHLQMVVSTAGDHQHTISIDEGIAGMTVREAQSIILDDHAHWPGRLNLNGSKDNPDLYQALGVPLMFYNKPIGVIVAGRRQDDPVFTRNDERLVTLLANLISPIVRNAQLYNRLGEAMKEAKRANDVKTRFLASVTHELRTPLNLIINNMDFMRIGEFGDVNEEQVMRLNQTIRSAEHLLYLINDLLDVSKIEAGEMHLFIQPSDPQPMIEDALDSALAYIEGDHPVTLSADIPPNLPLVPMDARRIRQVLTNLLSNAIKFTPQGDVRLTVLYDEDNIEFVVTDTGIGIPEDERHKLFKMFERTDRARQMGIEGTGLGLPISRYLVEAHGGEMVVESRVGVGSTFSFKIPLHRDEGSTRRVTAVMQRIEV
jgi:signal transduction histidine kinase/HAMP domain-containing protein